jgi:peroxiredoxin
MRKSVLIAVAVIGLAIGIWQASHRQSGYFKLGRPAAAVHADAPDFSIEDLDGKPLALANYRGKVLVLDFWATWCTPCREEIPHFVELQEKYREQGLQVIGISMDDDPKPVREFYQKFKMNYPVALGTTRVAEAYGGVLGLPINFLIGRDGRIAAKYVGAVEMPVVEQKINSLLQMK